MLRYHLAILAAAHLLRLPNGFSIPRKKYFSFLQSTQPSRGPGGYDSPQVEDENWDDDVEEEFRVLQDSTQSQWDLISTFLRWIRLQVSHFTALEILLTVNVHHGIDLRGGIKLSLLASTKIPRAMSCKLELWEVTVKKLAPQLSTATIAQPSADEMFEFDAQAAINFLHQQLKSDQFTSKQAKILAALSSSDSHVPFASNMHCEAILAALIKYVEMVVLDDGLKGMIKV